MYSEEANQPAGSQVGWCNLFQKIKSYSIVAMVANYLCRDNLLVGRVVCFGKDHANSMVIVFLGYLQSSA